MNTTSRPAARLTTERFDSETLALLDELDADLPEFGGVDLDVVFGTPLELHEAGELPHERWAGADMAVTLDALYARYARMDAARDITADDPTVTTLVRERLVDILVPYASQLRIAPSTAAAPLPLAA